MERERGPRRVLERAAEVFDLPGEVLAGLPKITMTGGRRIHIEGHRGIIQYERELIAVNCGAMILKIRGVRLDLVSMSAQELLIAGEVHGIDFES